MLVALTGRVLLAHHAGIGRPASLRRPARRLYGVRPSFDVVDTMSLQYALLSQGYDDEPPRAACACGLPEGQYGLPRYAAHAALTDALACAELYLAQVAELQATRARTLKSVLKG